MFIFLLTKICFENALLAYLTGNCQCGTNFFRSPGSHPFVIKQKNAEENFLSGLAICNPPKACRPAALCSPYTVVFSVFSNYRRMVEKVRNTKEGLLIGSSRE
jgi:hypothetical protein